MTDTDAIYTVSALTEAIRQRLESGFPFVWVRGQVSGLSRPASGHVYFSLKDEDSSLAAVWFRGRQKERERFDPLTGEVYEGGPRPSLAHSLENGQEIVCAGRIAVYGARGQYQLVVEFAQDAGLGRLHEEFERLREKLAAKGYFAKERKRPLPPHPRRVLLLTSPSGAALHDFLRLAEGRGLGASLRIVPVPVQGHGAPPQIIRAIEAAGREGWAEVLVLIRGGGSIEDLWAFNDEALAAAIHDSPLPVLAGIGHEVDFTLADMTADARAATPSHAAQMLWPERAELARRLRSLTDALLISEDRFMERAHTRLEGSARALAALSPARRLAEREERLAAALRLMRGAARLALGREDARLAALVPRLSGAARQTIESARRRLGAAIAVIERVPQRLPAALETLDGRAAKLEHAGGRLLERAAHSLERAGLRLAALDPHAPLGRGYALARKRNGAFVRRTEDVRAGERLDLVVGNGEIAVRVEGEEP